MVLLLVACGENESTTKDENSAVQYIYMVSGEKTPIIKLQMCDGKYSLFDMSSDELDNGITGVYEVRDNTLFLYEKDGDGKMCFLIQDEKLIYEGMGLTIFDGLDSDILEVLENEKELQLINK